MGTQPPLPQKGAKPPIFGRRILWPNGCMDQDDTWYGGRPRPCVRWGPSSPAPKSGRSPPSQFSSHVYCGQTAGWIKIPLGTEIGLGQATLCRWGPSSPLKKAQPPIFGPCLLRLNGWMHQDTTWYGGRPQPRRHCDRWGPSSPWAQLPNFRPMYVVAKRLDGQRVSARCATWYGGMPRPRRLC